jgi:CubicO group peptidase (beta-lactamase class C family)
MISRSTPDGSPGSSKLLTPITCAASSWATLALARLAPAPHGLARGQVEASAPSDVIDDFVRGEMQKRQVPGLSLAVIEGGKIVKAKGYGLTVKGGDIPVTATTLFQAGSISKPVSALAALRLVDEGKLSLDRDVNASLKTWKVPDNQFTKDKKVTLRGILSHSAGLTVHGFPAYATDAPIPTLVQVLNGETPANTAPIRVDIPPGTEERYSGGGYTVAQQMIIDVTGKSFPQFMQETVLGPLEMRSSTFEQPLPAEKAKITATAHSLDRSPVKGKWHIYPEMAAAGLWTNPSDLARFAIGVQDALSDKSRKTVSQKMARQMLTEQRKGTGLGLACERAGTRFDSSMAAATICLGRFQRMSGTMRCLLEWRSRRPVLSVIVVLITAPRSLAASSRNAISSSSSSWTGFCRSHSTA